MFPVWTSDSRRVIFSPLPTARDCERWRGGWPTPPPPQKPCSLANRVLPYSAVLSVSGRSTLVLAIRRRPGHSWRCAPIVRARRRALRRTGQSRRSSERVLRRAERRGVPSGRWLAYQSNESGRDESTSAPSRTSSGRWQVSTNGGRTPLWSRTGHELFYATLEGAVMSVRVRRERRGNMDPPRRSYAPGTSTPAKCIAPSTFHGRQVPHDQTERRRRRRAPQHCRRPKLARGAEAPRADEVTSERF